MRRGTGRVGGRKEQGRADREDKEEGEGKKGRWDERVEEGG